MPRSSLPRRAWDSTVTDLTKHKISRHELAARHERFQSHNAEAARRELERRASVVTTSAIDEALSFNDDASEALKELDAVEAELQRLAKDAGDVPPPSTFGITIETTVPQGLDHGRQTLASPAISSSASQAPESVRDDEMFEAVHAAVRARSQPVVDLEEEIAQFHRREDEQLASLDGDKVAPSAQPVGSCVPATKP